MQNNSFLIIIIFFILTGCSIKSKTVKEFQIKVDELELENLNQIKHILILPGEGCSGCISKAEKFVTSLPDNPPILVIFTNIFSVKILKHKTKLDFSTSTFYLDKENIFNKGRAYSIYPTVLDIHHGKVRGF